MLLNLQAKRAQSDAVNNALQLDASETGIDDRWMGSSGDPPLPRAGFRVLDCTKFLAGPYAAMTLAYDKHQEAGQ